MWWGVCCSRRGGEGGLARECGERIETIPGDITDPRHRQALADRLDGAAIATATPATAGACRR
jgi:hypothetical protein